MPFILAVIPRLFVVVFEFSQPILIRQTIRFVQASVTEDADSQGLAYLVVYSAIAIYVGLAVSSAAYEHQLNRLEVMCRGALISLVHHKALGIQDNAYEDGKAVALISTDVSSVEGSAGDFHDAWGYLVSVLVGISLLSLEVGWVWPLPLVFIFRLSPLASSAYTVPDHELQSALVSVGSSRCI